MPKAPPTLYNHNARPSASHVLNVNTSSSGHHAMSSKASNVMAPVAVAPKPEYHLMDLNVGNFSAVQELAPNPGNIDDEPQSQNQG